MTRDEVSERGATPNGVHYYVKGGHKFLDLEHKLNAPITGVKYVLPIDGAKFNELTMRAFRDPVYGVWYGNHIGWDKDGMPRFTKIKILAARYYNLELPLDRKEYMILQHHEAVRGSSFAKGKCFLRIEDHEIIALNNTKRIIESGESIQKVGTLTGKKLKDFARYLGVEVGNNSETIILGAVYEKAQKDPKGFMEKWNDDRRMIYEIVFRAKDYGLITEDLSKGFLWKNHLPLGNTLSNVVEKLKDDRELLSVIEVHTEDIEHNATKPIPQKVYTSVSENSTETMLKQLQKENEALKERLKANNDVLSQEMKTELEPVKVEVTDSIPMFRGRPVTGERGDEAVWKRNELVTVCEDLGLPLKDYKTIMNKSDLVAYINQNLPQFSQPSEEDYDEVIQEDEF